MKYGTIVVCGGGCYGGYYVRQLARARAADALSFDRVLVVDRDPICRVARLIDAISRRDVDAISAHAWRLHRTDDDSGAAYETAYETAYDALPIEFVADAWAAFFTRWFAQAIENPTYAANDAVVPSPLMPNLLADWVTERIGVYRNESTVQRVQLTVAPDTPWSRAGTDGSHYASFATWMCPINCIEPPRCPETRGARDWTMPAAVHAAVAAAAARGSPYDVVALFRTTHRAYGVGMFDVLDAVAADDAIRGAQSVGLRTLVASVSHCHGAMAELVTSPRGSLP